MTIENLALITNGVVTNIVSVDSADTVTINALGGAVLPAGSPVGIGWLYDGVNFTDPRYATLAGAQTAQIALLFAAYQNAIQQPVSYTSAGGVTKTYQADAYSQGVLAKMLDAYRATQTVPAGFYWVALDNTQVPFSYADMQNLAAAMGAQGWNNFQHWQNQKAAVVAIGNLPAWAAAAAEALNAEIHDGSGNIWKCTTAGTTGAAAPAWPSAPTTATTVADGTVVWTFVSSQVAAVQAVVW